MDEVTWRGAKAMLEDPARKKGRAGGNRITALVTNLATCSRCGAQIRLGPRDGGPGRRYVCPAFHCTFPEDWLDVEVLLEVQRQLPS